jgi:hypothetical protein
MADLSTVTGSSLADDGLFERCPMPGQRSERMTSYPDITRQGRGDVRVADQSPITPLPAQGSMSDSPFGVARFRIVRNSGYELEKDVVALVVLLVA